jgi:hypothetical protein
MRTLYPPNTSSAPTCVGTRLLLVSPRPSWPEDPKPHAQSAPFSPTAMLCSPPAATVTILLASNTCVHPSLFVLSPTP